MKNFIKILTAFFTAFSIVSTASAVTVDSAAYSGTQAYPIGSSGFCEVSSLDEIVLFSTPDNNSLADYFYAGITDASGTIPRGVTNTGAPNLGSQQGNSLYSGDQSVSAIVLQSDFTGPNAPTVSDPWYWTIWEGTANDPNAYYNSGTTRGAIVAQFPIADSVWDNPPGASGSNPCRPDINHPPVAFAALQESSVSIGSTANLSGYNSSDPDNDTLTYSWSQVSGPSVTLSDATSPVPSFTVPAGADTTPLVFSLIVNDGTVDSAADTISITAQISQGGLSFKTVINMPFISRRGPNIDPATCELSLNSPFLLYLHEYTGVVDDGNGEDNWIIEWYDYNGNFTGGSQGSFPVGTNSSSATQPPSLTPAWQGADYGTRSFPFFENPHTYRLYDADTNFNKIALAETKVIDLGDLGTSNWSNEWVACWEKLSPPSNSSPVAEAGSDQTTVAIASTVTLDASGSTDADNDTLTYMWTQSSGPAVTLSDATAQMPTFTVPAGADTTPIVFSLIVNDGNVDSAPDEVTIQAIPSNTEPIADAGADQTTLRPNETVTLDGSVSSDADGDNLTYLWTQVSGPAVTLDDATIVMPNFLIPLDAVDTPIIFQLVVNDGTVDSTSDQVSVQAVNTSPIANAGVDQLDPRPNDVVTLDGSASSDDDGDALTYLWTQVSGPAVTLNDAALVAPTFTIPLDAVDTSIVFNLVVNDGFESSPVDMVSIMAVNEAPVANAGPDQDDPRPNTVVTLDGSASSDPDGDVLTYLWTQVSGPTVTLDDAAMVSPSFTIPVEAVSTPILFELVVNDGFVNSAPDTVSIMAQNEAPIADAGLDQSDVIPGNNIDLDGSGSSDPDGDSLTYMWTQLSGTSVAISDSNTATPSFVAPGGGGELIFELIVNDGFVDSTPDQVSITVQDNVAVTSKAISEFLTVRNSLILSNQPDLQRRIDRLEGRSGKRGASSVSGVPIIGTSNLPVQVAMNGNSTTIAGSLTGLKNTDGNRKISETGSIDVWGEAYISSFNIDRHSGDFGIYYLGADYLISKDLLIGVLGQIDKIDFDDNELTGVTDGEGWMAGPYVTARLSDNLYADARASFGKSENTVSPFGTYTDEFETSRYLLAGSLTGEFDLSDRFTFRPEGNLQYLSETQDSYTDALGSTIPKQSSQQGQFSIAPRLQYNITNDNGLQFRPYAEIEGIHSFGDGVNSILGNDMRFRLEGGADMFSAGGFRASLSYFEDGIGTDNYDANGFRVSGAFTF